MPNIKKHQRVHINKRLNVAMYLTMALSLIVISVFASITMKSCVTAQIKTKHQVLDKFFYQLSNGSQMWSIQDFAVNERVCVSNPTTELAQK